jgi:uncharacterized protein (TIGR02452 family)
MTKDPRLEQAALAARPVGVYRRRASVEPMWHEPHLDRIHPTARDVHTLLTRGHYDAPSGRRVELRAAVDAALAGTRLHLPEEVERLVACGPAGARGSPARIEVRAATTQEAALDLFRVGREPVVLNFANAVHPGGGFLGGAPAQEEALCRSSALYPTLLTQPAYFERNRAFGSELYTDAMIHSPAVPFFRLSEVDPLLDEPFLVSVITAPAPNAGAIAEREPEAMPLLEETFARRWRGVLAVAQEHRHMTLVLGAWGAGAFRNDPQLVARTAHEALHSPRFTGAFEHVLFAIPARGEVSRRNLETFRVVFDGA